MSSPIKEETAKEPSSEKKITKKTSSEIETQCNLYDELTQEDEKLLEKIDKTEQQLKLKDQDTNAFWKSISETVRVDLQDALADNEEV